MDTQGDEGMARLERAVDVFMQWQDADGDADRPTFEELLDGHPDLRDILAPMGDETTQAAPPAPAGAPLDGRKLGEFRLEREVGRGGMGVVYEARQVSLNRRVALKVLPAHLTLHPRAIARFKREALTAARLKHPGIVPVLAVGEEQDLHYFAMEFIEGASLDQVLERLRREGGLAAASGRTISSCVTGAADGDPASSHWRSGFIDTMAGIALQVAEALAHAHAADVVHRDVKPSNIMVRADGSAVLTDFGLAREIGLPGVTVTGEFAGTPAYVAPEQARGEKDAIGPGSDVFSLGACLYELLTLQRAFAAGTAQKVLEQIEHHDPREPTRLNPQIPADLAAIVMKALEKEPRDRYRSGAELAADLRAFLDLKPVRARRTGRGARLRRWIRREPALAAAIGGLLVVLTAGLVVSLIMFSVSERRLLEYRSLADKLGLDELERLHEEIPELPEALAEMDEWLDDAHALVAERAKHQERLDGLRDRARPYDAAQRARDADRHPEAARLQELRQERRILSGLLEMIEDGEYTGDPSPVHERARRLPAELDRLEAWRSFELPTRQEQWFHDNLTLLLARIDGFTRPEGLIERMQERRDEAAALVRRTLEDTAAAWSSAVAAIADEKRSPAYGGLQLEPRRGLVPLGQHPESGLWEFWLPRSGAQPTLGKPPADRDALVFVLVPGGMFTMGADPQQDENAQPNEQPAHEVTLAPFFLSKYEMTQGQWHALTKELPSAFVAGNLSFDRPLGWRHPVENVSWTRAGVVLARFGLELPTEAQWEYAARAGSTGRFFVEPRGLGQYANFADRSLVEFSGNPELGESQLDDGHPGLAPAGSLLANAFGLHDMIGNVHEWVRDNYATYDISTVPGSGLRDWDGRAGRIARGGCLRSDLFELRSTYRRLRDREAQGEATIGLRPAMALRR